MQEQLLHAAEPGRRPAQQYAGVDLRRPKGYVAAAPPSSPKAAAKATSASAAEGEACPRCESRDTKFCYYNNYNTSQPRHFCKGCRRYWTKGGTLRSVPVGGGTRKRPASSSSSVKKPSKKRRAPTPPEPATDDDDVVTAPGNATDAKVTETTTTPPTDASASATASEITTELVVPAAVAVAEGEDSFTDLLHHGGDDAVALDLGFSDYPVGGGGKALGLGEPYSFEWPPAFDLGAACWGGAGFTDPDPGVFMNLP